MSLTWLSAAASSAVGPAAYLTIRLPVQAASAAVSGLPSDHLPPGFRWNVQVSPSAECDQLVAQSPSSFGPGPYCTSCGYSITNALYDWLTQRHERVQGVDVVDRPHAQDAALDDLPTARAARAAGAAPPPPQPAAVATAAASIVTTISLRAFI